MRIAPPGRRSISQIGAVNPLGPHQRASRSGCVHALNTSSRGASNVRVMTSSRFAAVDSVSLAAIHPLLDLHFTQIVVQAIEALVPEVAVPLHPVGDVPQRRRLQPA